MKESAFTITEYSAPLYSIDPRGRRTEFESRHSACFIITVKGSVRFTSEYGVLISDSSHPVFLPRGLKYVNECLSDAESYLFNFHTKETCHRPMALSAVPEPFVKSCYDTIKQAAFSESRQSSALVLRELYSLAHELFSEKKELTAADRILQNAIEFMMKHFDKPSLTVGDISKDCFISEIYLRKLFEKRYQTTPFKMLTEIRMKKAHQLLKEKRPLGEVASSVGYSDIFSFSRAFKKYYGHPPSKT